jgi:hypothetical protein
LKFFKAHWGSLHKVRIWEVIRGNQHGMGVSFTFLVLKVVTVAISLRLCCNALNWVRGQIFVEGTSCTCMAKRSICSRAMWVI